MSRLAARLAVCALLISGGVGSALAATSVAHGAGGAPSTETVTTSVVTTSVAPAVLAVSGHGYGHGLGLSQWGAYGYALHGLGAAGILAHYYPHTTLGTAPGRAVRVLVARGRRVTLASISPWRVVDGHGGAVALAPGSLTLDRSLKVHGVALVPPLTFSAAEPLQVNGTLYRGRLAISLDGNTVLAVDLIGLESYLRAVVPAEMPADWPAAALEAQAVAARSYALANRVSTRAFDLYGDTRDQAYGGVSVESEATTAAVDATKGQVVLYGGRVADALYFSTSGGRTASAGEELNAPVPYLVSVRDPYDAVSPYHDWGPVLYGLAAASKRLGLPTGIADVAILAGPSGRAETVTFTDVDGTPTELTGPQVRAALDLRSTWFTTSVFSLAATATSIVFGGATSLSGTIHSAEPTSLEARTAATDWTSSSTLSPGAFSTVVSPRTRTSYRLASGAVRAGLVTVTVTARCDATISSAGAVGTTRPAAPGAPVQLQRAAGPVWTTVGSAAASAGGAFSFGGPLAPGDYRARCAPGGGVDPGVSTAAALR